MATPLGFDVDDLPAETPDQKRRRLAFLKQRVSSDLEAISQLELEVGNHPCAACGQSHAGERCLDQQG